LKSRSRGRGFAVYAGNLGRGLAIIQAATMELGNQLTIRFLQTGRPQVNRYLSIVRIGFKIVFQISDKKILILIKFNFNFIV
jgi:hypothetical protein